MTRSRFALLFIAVVAFALSACAAGTDGQQGAAATSGLPTAGVGAGGIGATAGVSAGGVGGAAATGGAGAGTAGFAAGGVGGFAGTMIAGTGGSPGAGSGGAAGGGMAGSAAAGTGAGTGGTPGGGNTMGTVTVTLTTVSYGGEYAPLNYGAVWFEDPSGEFIKTAKRWAGTIHATDLVTWTAASGGWGSIFGGGNTADMMDAVSSATIRTHQTHMVTWNMMDSMGALVPDGSYVAVLEMSESRARDRNGPVVRIPFTKGPSPQTVPAADQEGFSGVMLQYEP